MEDLFNKQRIPMRRFADCGNQLVSRAREPQSLKSFITLSFGKDHQFYRAAGLLSAKARKSACEPRTRLYWSIGSNNEQRHGPLFNCIGDGKHEVAEEIERIFFFKQKTAYEMPK